MPKASFVMYDRDNPQIYELIVKFTKGLYIVGFRRYSMRAIMHRIRWHVELESMKEVGYDKKKKFKVSNNYSQDYALKIMKDYPILEGFFVIKMR